MVWELVWVGFLLGGVVKLEIKFVGRRRVQ